MAAYKYLKHTASEVDAAVDSQREHCKASDLHVCAEDKAALANCCTDVAALKSEADITRTTLGAQSYNLLKTSTKANITRNGLTFKVQSDGSIKVTGTATASTQIDVYVAGDWQSANVVYPVDSYRVHLKHDTDTEMTITVLAYDGTSQNSVWLNGSNVSKAFTNFVTGIYITFRPTNGAAYDNFIYPMLTYANVINVDYMPPQQNLNSRLTNTEAAAKEAKSQAAINRTALGAQHKNLLPYRCTPHANSGGVKVAVAENGVVTLSGTNTTSFTYNINFAPALVFDKDVFIVGAETLKNVIYNCKVDKAVNGSQYPNIGTAGLRIPAGTTINYLYFQQQTVGKEINATIAPMIVYADVTDHTYEPYTPSLQDQINALTARIAALESAAVSTTSTSEPTE